MRIGFIGNTNNLPYLIARQLAAMGHEIFFVVDKAEPLHRPEAYYPADPSPPNLVLHDVTGIAEKYIYYLVARWRHPDLHAKLKACDAVIANGLWAMQARATGRPYIVLLTGADLASVADPQALFHDYWTMAARRALPVRVARLGVAMLVSWALRRALRFCDGLSYYARGVVPRGDALLERIFRGLPQRRRPVRMALQFTDVDRLKPQAGADVPGPGLVILLAARHTWRHGVHPGVSAIDLKGSDIFIRGLALLRQQGIAFRVRMFEKGLDVVYSKLLVEQLGLADCVHWSREITQAQLLEAYRSSDVIADQFGEGTIAMAGLDAMAMGKPLLANGRPDVFEPLTGEPSPICQATTPQQVCSQLLRLSDPVERQQVGELSRGYVERHFSASAAARSCLAVLQRSAV